MSERRGVQYEHDWDEGYEAGYEEGREAGESLAMWGTVSLVFGLLFGFLLVRHGGAVASGAWEGFGVLVALIWEGIGLLASSVHWSVLAVVFAGMGAFALWDGFGKHVWAGYREDGEDGHG